MKTIYLCTDGDYSDYHISAAFDQKDLADKFVEIFGGEVETWDVNKYSRTILFNRKPYRVVMKKDGETVDVKITHRIPDSDGGDDFDPHGHYFYGRKLIVDCFAKSEKHAIKITNEYRIRLIAENKWPKKPDATIEEPHTFLNVVFSPEEFQQAKTELQNTGTIVLDE